MSTTAAGTSITERLVGALTAAWRAIQDRHPDVPDVVLTLGSGTLGARRGEVNLGHFAAGRWHTTAPATTPTEQHDQHDEGDEHDQHGEGDEREDGEPAAPEVGMAELFVGGEGLRRGARGGAWDAAARGRARGGHHPPGQGH